MGETAKNEVSAAEKAFVRVEVEVWEKETDQAGVIEVGSVCW